jgi:FMN reductase [NAD(P)H]
LRTFLPLFTELIFQIASLVKSEYNWDMNETLKIMAMHRSVRKYKKLAIPDNLLDGMLNSARQASTSANLQAYSIIVVKDQDKKERLAKFCGDQVWVARCQVFLVICPDLFRLEKVVERQGYTSNDKHLEMFIVATVDAALVAQNILTAAESCGLGGVMIGGIRNHPHEVCELLELPEKVYPLMGMCLGYPDQDAILKPRLQPEVVIHYEKYDDAGLDEYLDDYDKIVQATGLYDGSRRKVPSPAGKEVAEQDYSWREHTSRRLASTSPRVTRAHMRQFLIDRGFGLK